jgi:hypothetical protein
VTGAWHKVESPWPKDAEYDPPWCGPSKSKSAALERVAFWSNVSTAARAKTVWRDRAWVTPPSTGCWQWMAPTPSTAAAVIAWQLTRGHLPPGTKLDRLCELRSCVKPDHHEPGAF